MPLEDASSLIVAVITIYEVFKVVLRGAGEHETLQSVAAMQKGKVIDLSISLSLSAAKLRLKHYLPMAESIVLATAELYRCVIWTQDAHFENLSGVTYFPKHAQVDKGIE